MAGEPLAAEMPMQAASCLRLVVPGAQCRASKHEVAAGLEPAGGLGLRLLPAAAEGLTYVAVLGGGAGTAGVRQDGRVDSCMQAWVRPQVTAVKWCCMR